MSIRKLRAGRVPAVTAQQYVGERGTIFWNESNGALRLSDGVTLGGLSLPIDVSNANVGDLNINGSTISTVNADEDINLSSNGSGKINVVGEFHVHTTAGGLSDPPVVSVDTSGFTTIRVPVINTGDTGLLINGDGATPNTATRPQVGGTTFRSIGNDGMLNALTVDANGTGVNAGVTARLARGTAQSPTAVQTGDTIGRYAAVGWGSTNYVIDPVLGRAATDMRFVATENYTDAHGGSKVQFFTSPNGGTVRTLSAEIHSDGVHLPNSGLGITFPDGSRQVQAFEPTALPHPLLPADDNITDLGDADHRFRNLYLGPASLFMADTVTDANIELRVTSGTLYINGAQNLAVGDLTIVGNTVQARLPSIDINMGDPADTGLFTIGRQTVITTPNLGAQTAALLINGTLVSPVEVSPLTFDGTMIHTVAQVGQSARMVQDAYGELMYPIYVGRKARGTIASPTAVGTGDVLLRISANGYTDTGFMTGGSARVDFVATEPNTSSARGSRIDFWTTPNGTTSITNNASVSNDGFVGNGIRFTSDDTYQTTAGIPLSQKAVPSASYVATLGVDGKLDASQIPSSLSGAVVFKGSWNANTNTPALSDTLPAGLQAGWEYVVSVGGTRDIGDGSETFAAGDFVIYDGTHWKRIAATNNLTYVTATTGTHVSVNGNQGTQETGILTFTTDATPLSTFSTIVSRDATGNFAANMITANLTGNVTGTVSGNAGTVTNGVYTTGTQSIDGTKTFTSTIQGSISGNATTATNMTGGVLGSVGYQSSPDNTAMLAPNTTTTKKFLRMTGTGIVGAVPAWDTVTATDVGLGNVTNESKATMFSSPTFTGTVAGVTATMVGLGNVENTALSTSTHYIGTTSIQYNRASGAQTLAGVSISGNAGTVTNGVYTTDTSTVTNTMLAGSIANAKLANSTVTVNGTSIALGASATVTAAAGTLTGTTLNSTVVTSSLTSVGTLTNLAIAAGGTITTPRVVINDGGIRTVSGGTTCTIDFATDSYILWTAPSGTAAITLSNYTAGARVKLMIALTTSRDVTYGISAAANSSTGADNWNGAGPGSVDISNTTMFLDYVCMSGVAGGCYLAVTVN